MSDVFQLELTPQDKNKKSIVLFLNDGEGVVR